MASWHERERLFAGLLEEGYKRNLPRGMIFTQTLTLHPVVTKSNAFSATGNALLTLPLYKRLNSSAGVADEYLDDPHPGFRKNSFQFTFGLTYRVQ